MSMVMISNSVVSVQIFAFTFTAIFTKIDIPSLNSNTTQLKPNFTLVVTNMKPID